MDEDSDTEKESLLPKSVRSNAGEDLFEGSIDMGLKYASSSEDEADKFDSEDDTDNSQKESNDEDDELLGKEHLAISSSSVDEDFANGVRLIAKDDSSMALICDMSNENLFNETLEIQKIIDNDESSLVCKLVDGITVGKAATHPECCTDISELPSNVNNDGPRGDSLIHQFVAEWPENPKIDIIHQDNEFVADFNNVEFLLLSNNQIMRDVFIVGGAEVNLAVTKGDVKNELIQVSHGIEDLRIEDDGNNFEIMQYSNDKPIQLLENVYEPSEKVVESFNYTHEIEKIAVSNILTEDNNTNKIQAATHSKCPTECNNSDILTTNYTDTIKYNINDDDDVANTINNVIENTDESNQQHVSNIHKNFKKNSESSKEMYFTSTESMENDQPNTIDISNPSTSGLQKSIVCTEKYSLIEIPTESKIKLNYYFGEPGDVYNNRRRESGAMESPLLSKFKQHSSSDLYLTSNESMESDQLVDFKVKRKSLSDIREQRMGEVSESDNDIVVRNKSLCRGIFKGYYESIRTESTETNQQLHSDSDGNLNKHSSSSKDLYLTSIESMESDHLCDLKAKCESTTDICHSKSDETSAAENCDKYLDQCKNIIKEFPTETEQQVLSNINKHFKEHMQSSDQAIFTKAESMEKDREQCVNNEGAYHPACVLKTYKTAELEEYMKYTDKRGDDSENLNYPCGTMGIVRTPDTTDYQPCLHKHFSDPKKSPKESLELFHSAMDIHEYDGIPRQESYKTPDLESGYFDKSDNVVCEDRDFNNVCSGGTNHLLYDQTISESLRNQLNRFDILIETMDKRNTHNIATKSIERGYWSTIFGQASEIESFDELSIERSNLKQYLFSLP